MVWQLKVVVLDDVSVVVEITLKMVVAFFERLLALVVGWMRPVRSACDER